MGGREIAAFKRMRLVMQMRANVERSVARVGRAAHLLEPDDLGEPVLSPRCQNPD